MTDECRSDCIEKLLFPKPISNRPGLSRISYRIGTYRDMLGSLHRKLDQNAVLADWTHREADDPGIALLEGASILGDILTFYQEVYANEAYLRTAQWRESVADLVRLLGYRLSPGVGGRATFAFDVKGDKPVVIPAGFPVKAQLEGQKKSVDFQTTHQITTLSFLNKFNLFKPITYPKITPQTKEFYIYQPAQSEGKVTFKQNDRILIGNPQPAIAPTRILNCEIVVVDSVRELHGRKIFKIKGALNRESESEWLVGYKLGRTFKHFGHSAPRKYIKTTSDNKIVEEKILYSRSLNAKTQLTDTPTISATGASGVVIVDPSLDKIEFPLESNIEDLPMRSEMVIQCQLWGWDNKRKEYVGPKKFTLIETIENINSLSMTWGSISGEATLVTFGNKLTLIEDSVHYYVTDIRYIQFNEVTSPLLRMRASVTESIEQIGNVLNYYGTAYEAQHLIKRQLAFEYPNGNTFIRRVNSVIGRHWDSIKSSFIQRNIVILNDNVDYFDFPNENPKVTVYGNLIDATQGKTEKEAILGNGDNREAFQTFKLPKAPLTYFISKDETPPEVPELQVYVNDRLWARVPSLYGHGPKEQIYIVREDDDNHSWVQFGDGKTGARLPSGLKNVVVRYRTGTGAYGHLKEGATPQPGTRLDRLRKIHLPGIATGGSEPEDADNAREAAPGKIQSLGRLVSLKDFEAETLGISGVEKASANWRLEKNIPTVIITALMESGREKEGQSLQATLNAYNRDRGPDRFPVSVHLGRRQYVYLTLVVGYDPSCRQEPIHKAIKEVLGVTGEAGNGFDGSKGLFSVKHRRFGQPEYTNRIKGVVQNVKGVIWTTVTSFGFVAGDSDDPLKLTRPGTPQCQAVIPEVLSMKELTGTPQPAMEDVLFCLHVTHLDIIPGTVNATEVIADE